eukprot:403348446
MSKNTRDSVKKKDDDFELTEDSSYESRQLRPVNQAPTQEQVADIEDNNYDINPMKKKCTYCNVEVVTYVEHESHPMFMIFAIMTLLIFGFLSVVILPLAYLATKNAVHRCSRCLQKLGEKQCFGVPTNFQDEIWQFRLGKCHVVMARGYALGVLLLFTLFSVYYVYMRPGFSTPLHPYEVPKESKEISYTWEDFLQDCGGTVIVENNVHARNIFNEKYESNIVSWKGNFAESKVTNSLPFFGSDHALNVLIKMQPSESPLYPDLVLSLNSQVLSEKRALLKTLKKGDELWFRAKIMTLGNEFKLHHLHAMDFDKTGEFKEFNEILVRESTLP